MYMACIVYLEFSWQGDYLLSRPDTYIARALSSGDPQPPAYKPIIYITTEEDDDKGDDGKDGRVKT